MQEKGEEHFVGLVSQKAIIERDGKVLMIRNKGDQEWDFPGGRLNTMELPAEGLAREVQEEIGCNCQVGEIVYVNQYTHFATQTPCVYLFYKAGIDGDITIATDELSEYEWIDPAEMRTEDTFTDYVDILRLAVEK